MNYFYIEPEVAGELGEQTVMDSSVHPPRVQKLHYKFVGWLGDALLESFPCVIATQGAAEALEELEVTGVQFADLQVTISEEFRNLYPERKLPSFKWLKVTGAAGKDDFGIATDFRLVISDKAMRSLQHFGIGTALTERYG